MDASGPRGRFRLIRRRLGLLGFGLTATVVVAAVGAPFLSPYDPLAQDIVARLRTPQLFGPPSHPLGTDHLGRDVLSRILHGSSISLAIAASAVALGGTTGVAAGLVAGYFRGSAENLIMRLVEIQLAFPLILLVLAMVAVLGASASNIVLIFALATWPLYATVIRGQVIALMEREFIGAARALGGKDAYVILRHVMPNVVSPLTVVASFEFARLILTEAAIGFLGLGIHPPTPTWGNMLADGRAYIHDAWWLTTFPGLAIALTATGINLIGDTLRDMFDPRLLNIR